MLGFGGCEKDANSVFTTKGTVLNKGTGKPIEGIQVEYGSPWVGPIQMYGIIGVPYIPKARVLTDAKGKFKLTDRFHDEEFLMINNNRSLIVSVIDVDNEKNALFQQEQLFIDITEYNRGEYTLNVELTEIEKK